MENFETNLGISSNEEFFGDICDSYILKQKPLKGKLVDVRTEPKINRNATCPKCESGLKYKKCCGKF